MSELVVAEMRRLVEEARRYHADDGGAVSEEMRASAGGWMAAALHIARAIVVDANNSYVGRIIQTIGGGPNFGAHNQVAQIAEILTRLADAHDRGVLPSVADQTSALVFDDLLDHAATYVDANRKEPAGVVAGVVFEDAIRRACVKRDLNPAGKTLEPMIEDLVKAGALNKLDAKAARHAAGLRTSATHALWEEFDINNVKATIELTRKFIEREFSS